MWLMEWLKGMTPTPTTSSRSNQAKAQKTSKTKRMKAIAGDRTHEYAGRASKEVGSSASAPYNAPKPKARPTRASTSRGGPPSSVGRASTSRGGPPKKTTVERPSTSRGGPPPNAGRPSTSRGGPPKVAVSEFSANGGNLPAPKVKVEKKKATKFSRGNAHGTRTFRKGSDI